MRAELVESIRVAIEEAQRQADAEGREVLVIAVPPAPVRNEAPAWEGRFLEELKRCGSVTRACELVGVSRATVYRRRQRCGKFANRWKNL